MAAFAYKLENVVYMLMANSKLLGRELTMILKVPAYLNNQHCCKDLVVFDDTGSMAQRS